MRCLINWLTVKTGEGDLFEIDTALRPNGNSGLLVTTFDGLRQAISNSGSNTAWTWGASGHDARALAWARPNSGPSFDRCAMR